VIDAENLRLSLGGRSVFTDVSFRVSPGHRVCIAGRNGQGKSTLMKVILGLQSTERGTMRVGKGRSLGYLPQDLANEVDDLSVVEKLLASIPELDRLEREIAEVTDAMSANPEDESLLARYGRAQAAFEAMDGYAIEAKARTILAGLGFTQERMNSPMKTLSGGWQMRVYLARLLLTRPDAMLLDEPTNHLDLESREWLLTFLGSYEGALLITSHDRYFLDQLVDRVFELERGELTVYHGNYSRYEVQRAERSEHLKLAYARQQRELKRQEQFIERNRAKAATASNVQSRIKQLAKVERIVLPYEPPAIRLRFPEPRSGGQLAFRLDGLGKSYGETEVFRDLNLELPAGEKLAVVGVNGAGKTTLLKILADRLDPTEGALKLGHEVTIQYFSQYEDNLPHQDYTLLQAMQDASPPEHPVPLRTILGCFLFTGDDVHKPLRVLSGGERARLKLARMLLKPSNLLVMDEPTNHLDLHSKGVLLDAMQNFGGTVVFVSHDRAFLKELATSVLSIEGGQGRFFPSDYEQYRWRLGQERKEAAAAREAAKKRPAGAPADAAPPTKTAKAKERKQDRARKKKLKRLKRKVTEAQADVETKEARLAELEGLMSSAGFFDDPKQSEPVVSEHKHLQVEIELAYEAFELALSRADQAEAEA
jgi:ATP-binding cassette subfamily F protein 3